MKALIQRVKSAKVEASNRVIGEINNGLLVFLGVTHTDTEEDINFLVDKIANLRIFEDDQQKMNLSLKDVKGEILVVSQFTLYADCKGGRRPSFTNAAAPQMAKEMYTKFIQKCKGMGLVTAEGEFGAMMDVSLVNSGPVTIMLDTDENSKPDPRA
jgi:D-tyrosyl-tRNA(Tyr) deacylase